MRDPHADAEESLQTPTALVHDHARLSPAMTGETSESERAAVTRVLIVADDPLVRSGLGLVIGTQSGATVVGQLSSRDDVATEARGLHPDAVLWDLGADARAAADRMADLSAMSAPMLLLLPDGAEAIDALVAGASGALLRNTDGAAVVDALRAISHGMIVLDRAFAGILPTRERTGPRPSEDLTAREVEVLQLLAAGLPNKVIAQRLGISDHTVKFHVNAIMTKLGVQSRTEAVVRAARLGLVIL